MQRRDFLRGLCGAAASLLGLGAVKAVASSGKEPLRVAESFEAGYTVTRCRDDGCWEKLSGGTVRFNRMPEPGESIPSLFPSIPLGWLRVEQRLTMSLYEPTVNWSVTDREVESICKVV